MAFQKGIAEISIEVTPAPGCFLEAAPSSVKIAQGDLATFQLTITRLEGYDGPIYLRAVNLGAADPQPADPAENGHHFTPNPIPAGQTTAVLTIETDGWTPGPALTVGLEALDALPDGEYPVT